MAIAYDARRATRDIDAVFEPKARVCEAVDAVTQRHEGLDDGWLNDAVKGLMLGLDPSATLILKSESLTVSAASPGYLFAMKAAASRVERDSDDLTELYRLNGFQSGDRVRSRRCRSCSPVRPGSVADSGRRSARQFRR